MVSLSIFRGKNHETVDSELFMTLKVTQQNNSMLGPVVKNLITTVKAAESINSVRQPEICHESICSRAASKSYKIKDLSQPHPYCHPRQLAIKNLPGYQWFYPASFFQYGNCTNYYTVLYITFLNCQMKIVVFILEQFGDNCSKCIFF